MRDLCGVGLVVAVSGKPGSGKTTLARSLARELGLRYVSMGQIFRNIALERGVSIEELSRVAERDSSIDYLIDSTAVEEAKKGCVVVDGHIAAWILRDLAHIKILTYAPLPVRAERLAKRDGKTLEDALREIRTREESEARRYRKYYNIDVNSLEVFDAVINTSLLSEEEVVRVTTEIVKAIAQTKFKKEKKKIVEPGCPSGLRGRP
ncbi:MAG: AAA family ATPase [Sulfolobales archaeon]|nr:AAA family ATPase [Sulfolobales archaeon]MDW8083529.1 AAA family ATPase [Sulfolobales archaeon]